MKKEVGTVCISTTPSSLYVGYPKTTVPIYLVPTHGRSGTLFLLLLRRTVGHRCTEYSIILYILARTSESVEIN